MLKALVVETFSDSSSGDPGPRPAPVSWRQLGGQLGASQVQFLVITNTCHDQCHAAENMTQDTEWRLFNSELELGTLPAPTSALFLMRTVGLVSVSHSDILTYQT